jgi:hypothetical protein
MWGKMGERCRTLGWKRPMPAMLYDLYVEVIKWHSITSINFPIYFFLLPGISMTASFFVSIDGQKTKMGMTLHIS